MTIELTIHGTGIGQCTLTGKEGEGLTVSFKDGTVSNCFLSHKAFQQLLKMKLGQAGKPTSTTGTTPVAQAVPVASTNGSK